MQLHQDLLEVSSSALEYELVPFIVVIIDLVDMAISPAALSCCICSNKKSPASTPQRQDDTWDTCLEPEPDVDDMLFLPLHINEARRPRALWGHGLAVGSTRRGNG